MHQMALNTSFPIFTERLEIRGLEVGDVNACYVEALNDTEYMRNSQQSLKVHTLSSQLEYVKSFDESSNHILAVTAQDHQRLVGTLTLRPLDAGEGVDMGVLIFPQYSGNRYASEAWNALINHLSRQYAWISGGCAESNLPMISIMESSNMIFERQAKNLLALSHGIEDAIFFRYLSSRKDKEA
jgi:RimJ/RimL family protein N-acetyltransferase